MRPLFLRGKVRVQGHSHARCTQLGIANLEYRVRGSLELGWQSSAFEGISGKWGNQQYF